MKAVPSSRLVSRFPFLFSLLNYSPKMLRAGLGPTGWLRWLPWLKCPDGACTCI